MAALMSVKPRLLGNSTSYKIPDRPFRIAAAVWTMFVNNCSLVTLKPTKRCPNPGIDAEILGFVLEFLDIPYEIYPFYDPDVDWGNPGPSGEWSGLIGAVINGTYDTISAMYVGTPERRAALGFSYPVRPDDLIFMTRKVSSVGKSAYLAFNTFTPSAWSVIISSFFGLSIGLIVGQALNIKGDGHERRNRRGLFRLYSFFFDHGPYDFRQSHYSGHLLLVCLFLLSMFATSLYQTALLTQLLASPLTEPFTSNDDMIARIKSGEYRMATESLGIAYYQSVALSNGSHYVKMRDALRGNPIIVNPNGKQLFDRMEVENLVYPTFRGYSVGPRQSRCYLTVFQDKDKSETVWLGYVLPPNNSWAPILQEGIVALTGYINLVIEKYYKLNSPQCEIPVRKERPLKLDNLMGLFMLLLLGFVAGLLGFSWERIRLCWKNGRKELVNSQSSSTLTEEHSPNTILSVNSEVFFRHHHSPADLPSRRLHLGRF